MTETVIATALPAAAATGGIGRTATSLLPFLLPFLVLAAIFYFFIIRRR